MGLWQNFQSETVSRLSLREPVVGQPTETVGDAIRRMREKKLGCVIIINEENQPLGVLTENRLTQLLSEHGSGMINDPIQDHMVSPCPQVRLSDPISLVVDAMQEHNIRFLCVVDDQGKVAGLTGQKGLIEFVADHFPGQVMVQRIGGEPYPSTREGA